MKKYAVFFHIWTSSNHMVARLLVDEQIKRLNRSGLRDHADIFCVVTGDYPEKLNAIFEHYPWLTILEVNCPKDEFEYGTLKYLYDACSGASNYEAVMYFHTKGVQWFANPDIVSKPGEINMSAINSWRHYMEYFVIDRWEEAVSFLNEYSAAGCCMLEDPGGPYFAGNFWWARPSYIATLRDPRESIAKEDNPIGTKRHGAERWIGTNATFNDFKILAGISFPVDALDKSGDLYFSDMEFSYLDKVEA